MAAEIKKLAQGHIVKAEVETDSKQGYLPFHTTASLYSDEQTG